MPPRGWVALAMMLSASIGAATARAVGRAYRASGRPPKGIRTEPLPPGIPPAERRPEPSSPRPEMVPQVTAVADASGMNVRISTRTDRPVEVAVQRLHTDGSTSEPYRAVLPAGSPPEATSGSQTPRFPERLRLTASTWGSTLRRFGLWSSLKLIPLDTALVLAAAVLYLATRLWSIDSFPIYFYSDEVNSVWFGEQAIKSGMLGEDGSWPAVYFLWDENRREPGDAVYLYGLTGVLFGNSVFVARATGALISLSGVLALAWLMKDGFQSRFWWASILLAAAVPCWFLYSRNAYAPLAGVSFYAVFLLAYARYRVRSPGALGWAAVAGALAFYSYGNLHAAMVGLAVCLLVSDFRYHLEHRRVWVRTLPLLAILAVPFLEYRILHPEAMRASLTALDSYWVQDLPLAAKLLRYVQNYLTGLNPIYWFAPQTGTDILPVQSIPGVGHLGFVLLPLVAVGLYVCARNLRSPLHRLVFFSALVIPASSALDTIEIIRVLGMVIPALVLGTLGLQQLGDWLQAVARPVQTAATALILVILVLTRTVDALAHGPTWTTDYELEGAQFGAKAVFEEAVPSLLAQFPKSTIVMNTTWANNAHQYLRFFLSPGEKERIAFGNVRDYLYKIAPLDPGTIIVMLPEEYADAVASPLLGRVDIIRTVYRPDGDPGFYFAHIAYAADAERVLQELEANRVQLVKDQADILGEPTTVLHSRLADGSIANLFDGSTDTLVRGDGVNPFQIEIRFPAPRPLEGIRLTTGSFGDFAVSVTVTPPGLGQPMVVSERYRDLGPDPTVVLTLPSAGAPISSLRVEVTDNAQGPTGVIHVREIELY